MPLRPKMELREYGELFRRRKWMIVFSFLSILLGASVYCVVTPELYMSSTTILIIPQSVPQDYVRSTVSVKVGQQIGTIKLQVLSRTTLTKVMEELRLFEKERKKLSAEEVVEMMRKRIGIEVVQGRGRDGGSDTFTLSFLHENRQMAMHAASRLASFFIDENLKTREQQAVGTSEFLESQLKDTKAKLEQLEDRVKDYKMRHMGELPQQTESNLRVLTGLQDRLRAADTAIRIQEDRKVYLEAHIGLMEKSLAAAAGPGKDNGASVLSAFPEDPAFPLLQQHAQKKARLAELSARYTAAHPSVVAARQEVAEIEKRIAEVRRSNSAEDPHQATPTVHAPVPPGEIHGMKAQLESVTAEISSLQRDRAQVEKSVAAMERKLEQSPRREQEMISMVRDYENQRRSYEDLLRKKLEADVAQNLEKRQKGTQFQILDPANLPEDPFRPDRKKVMGISFALALAFGFGGAIFLETMDQTLRDVPDFKHLFNKVPILGYIPVVQDREYRRALTLRRAAVFGGLVTFTLAFSIFLLVYNEKIRHILNF